MLTLPRHADGDCDIGSQIEIQTVTFAAAGVVVPLRFHAQFKYMKLGSDDYLMFGAIVNRILLSSATELTQQN
jgi:hypothetical protein